MDLPRIHRRRFLQLGGGGLFALPFLPSLMGETHAGGEAPRAKRFVFLFTSNGQRPENWYPTDPAQWNVTSATDYVREVPLSDYAGGLSPICGPEFDPLLEKMILFRGLDFIPRKGGGHVPAAPLNGWQVDPAPTIDQILAASSAVYPTAPPRRSVHLMVKQAFQAETTCSMDLNLQGIPHATSTAAVYQQLFADFVPPDDAGAQQKLALRLDVLDRARTQYDALLSHPRLGSEDRDRLAAHGALISDLHDSLAAVAATCEKPDDPGDVDLGMDQNLELATQIQTDLLVAGLLCDRTRIATFMLCPGTDLRDFSYMGGPGGDHHGLSHDGVYNPASSMALRYINNWYAKQVAALLVKLDALIEDPIAGTSYLDNSIVYWGNEDGCNGYDAHAQSAMPVLLAGSAGGRFATGRYIDYRQVEPDGTGAPILYDAGGSPANIPTDFRGRPYNSLLISILQGMGLQPADYEQGGPGIGDYGGNYQDQYSIADGQQPLPGLDV
jgi:hypothetical protein